jgi:hypothetical protein
MDRIREQLLKPQIIGPVSLVVGLVIGLVVLGWGLFPVQWKDATPALLRQDLKEDYLRMTIMTYTRDQDKITAQQRWQELGSDAPALLAAVQAAPKGLTPAELAGFNTVVQAGNFPAQPNQPAASTPVTQDSTKTRSMLTTVLGVMCGATLIIAAVLAYLLLIRNRRGAGTPGKISIPGSRREEAAQVERAFSPVLSKEPPVAQFMTTYNSGDEAYDDSFSIDSPTGEFLGECGVGMSETIGVGDPKKITAFEVWLFDKNDIQTVTKVLMSDHAFEDPTIKTKLESKGEPVLTEPGKRVLLETATLQLEARVVDMDYGQGPMPPCSFFERLTLELSIWPKK